MRISKISSVLLKIIIGWVICYLYFSLTSCSPRYSEIEAREKFGCKVVGEKIDSSAPPVIIERDTIRDTIREKGETIYKQSPCKELRTMKKGEKKTETKGGTTQTYGIDSAGNDYFISSCDSLQKVSAWYKEKWQQTVVKTITQKDAPPIPEGMSWWDKVCLGFRYAVYVWCFIATLVLILKFKSG